MNNFKARIVNIGNVAIGGDNPVRVQSMTNTDTLDTKATVEQSIRLINAGCELVRITAQSIKEAYNLKNIKEELYRRGYKIPLIADVHFNPAIAEAAAAIVEKVRINPGNYIDRANAAKLDFTDKEYNEELKKIKSNLLPLIKISKVHGTVLRIGSNHGSLSKRILLRYGDTPLGMVESAMEFVRICNELDFHNLVLSMKASNVKIMVNSNRLLVSKMMEEGFDYPVHLGVTEAGEGEDGIIRSAIGIGALLLDGIGNTIRVSLTGDPVKEIPAAYSILQSAGLRITKTEYISCPTCGRTNFNIEDTLKEIKEKTGHLKGLKIAVMGCIVNGPGEMADADYGYVGSAKGRINLYKGQSLVKKNIYEKDALAELIRLIKDNNEWKEFTS